MAARRMCLRFLGVLQVDEASLYFFLTWTQAKEAVRQHRRLLTVALNVS